MFDFARFLAYFMGFYAKIMKNWLFLVLFEFYLFDRRLVEKSRIACLGGILLNDLSEIRTNAPAEHQP